MTTTYDALVEDTPITLMAQNRTMLTAGMPLIIRQAEDEICQRLNHDAFRSVIQTPYSISPGVTEIDLSAEPDEVYEVRSMRIVYAGQVITLEKREIERLSMTISPNIPGVPRFYAEDDAPLTYRFYPTPDTTYALTIRANQRPSALSASTQTNVLTDKWTRVLEMGVYKHGCRFMKNAKDEDRYGRYFEDALKEANDQLTRRRRDDTDVTVADIVNTA